MATADDLAKLDLDELEFLQKAVSPKDPSYGLLAEAMRQKRNPALTPERQAKVAKQYEDTKLPEPGTVGRAANSAVQGIDKAGRWLGIIPEENGTVEDAGTAGGVARNVGKQLMGTAAGAVNAVPFLGRSLEAIGEGENRLLGDAEQRHLGGAHLFPRRGELSQIEESSPSPTMAKVSGAVGTMTGGLGRLAAAPYEAGKALVSKVPLVGKIPGVSTVGGGAAGAAGVATGDAAIRRVPSAIAGEEPEPLDWVHEIAAPTVLGGIAASPGAVAEAATHIPVERQAGKLTGGQIARRYSVDRAAGKQFTPETERSLQDAIEEAKKTGSERTAETMRKAKLTEDEGQVAAKRMQEEDLAKLAGEDEATIASAAASGEGQLRSRFASGRKAAKGSLERTLEEVDADPRTHDPATGEPIGLPTEGFFGKLRQFVAEQAREDTANPEGAPQEKPRQPSTILDESGRPMDLGDSEGAPPEKHLGLGAEMRSMEEQLKGYLGESASIRDYRNAILAFQKKAESGTPLQKYAYTKALAMLRDHLADVDPTRRVAEANQAYRKAAAERERVRGIVYGKEGEKLGEGSPESRFDNPDEDGTLPSITPQEELRGAQFMRKADSPELAEHARELRTLGYGDLLDAMAEAKANREQFSTEAKRKGEDALMRSKMDSDLRLDKLNRSEKAKVDEEVGDRSGELKDFETGREARDASAWPSAAEAAKDVGYGAVGLMIPHHLGSPLTLLHGIRLGQKLAQPLRSRAAYYLPDAGAYEAGLGPSLGGMVGALDSREWNDRIKLNLDKLRRLRASLGMTE